MTQELTILAFCAALGLVHLFATSLASIRQRGVAWAAGPRDVPGTTLQGLGGRVDRAFKNFLETFPFFVTAVLISHAAGCHNDWTLWGCRAYFGARVLYIPAYVSGVPFARTAMWAVALAGIVSVLVAPLL